MCCQPGPAQAVASSAHNLFYFAFTCPVRDRCTLWRIPTLHHHALILLLPLRKGMPEPGCLLSSLLCATYWGAPVRGQLNANNQRINITSGRSCSGGCNAQQTALLLHGMIDRLQGLPPAVELIVVPLFKRPPCWLGALRQHLQTSPLVTNWQGKKTFGSSGTQVSQATCRTPVWPGPLPKRVIVQHFSKRCAGTIAATI